MSEAHPGHKVEMWPLAKLIPYARNARTHSDQQVAQIAASIKEWGFTFPVLANPEGSIIAGHGRALAARMLGLETVPVIVARGWSETKTRAYVIADNKIAMNAGWDTDMLRVELDELKAMDFDLALTGWSAEDIDALDLDSLSAGSMSEGDSFGSLPSGDKQPFQSMTFTLHDGQVDHVKRAIAQAKSAGDFSDSPNENSNGNALALICEGYISGRR